MQTPTKSLADHLLGEPAGAWVARRRGGGASWRRISLDLRDATSGQIDVTPQTVSTWAEADEAADDAPAAASG